MIGLIRSEIGVGESSRLAAAALDAAGVPFGMIDLPGISLSRSWDTTWLHKEMSAAPFPVNIFHLNADVMPMARSHFGSELFEDRYNIGYWHWELPIFPDEQLGGFAQLQEIWVPSQYVFESLLPKSPVCVVKIPHGISMPPPVDLPREYFGLPRSPFLFLSMYDSYSFQQRKNPKAAIEAYLRAFPEPKPDQVGLVIKINNAHEQDLEQVRAFTGGRPDCHIITPVLSRMQMNALLHSVQCFVSLHRSEGFGLGLAEAMYLGKPVIGTYWSGNTEFMNPANSCTVDFSLVHVGTDLGPYQAYQLWAEPNLDHAAYYMKRLLTDTVWRNTLADNGRQTIHTYFSAPLAGQRIRERLAQLGF
ncbi:glycosyl transferase family 1 [Paenibacillus rigui]|uniref:Glycosyl transferase family 1 n=1 Tax=Paenibacillus rigui TaxID=554312 RepID=A0A229UTM6_9BACL|nr:glycosyl transferase family 1 [Paenibacillus rigui]